MIAEGEGVILSSISEGEGVILASLSEGEGTRNLPYSLAIPRDHRGDRLRIAFGKRKPQAKVQVIAYGLPDRLITYGEGEGEGKRKKG